jgi:CheY-like chemotaxis protein
MAFHFPGRPASHPTPPNAEIARTLAARQLRLLYQRMGIELFAQLLAGLVVVAALASTVPGISLGAWYLTLSVVIGLRFLVGRVFAATSVVHANVGGWSGAASGGALITGVVWGLLAIAHSLAASPVALGVTLATAGAVSGVCLYCMAPSKTAFPLFLLTANAPWAIELTLGRVAEPIAVGVSLVFQAIFLALFASVYSASRETAQTRSEPRRASKSAPAFEATAAKTFASPPMVKRQTITAIGQDTSKDTLEKRPPEFAAFAADETAPRLGLNEIASRQQSATQAGLRKSQRILLVEDNPDNQLVAMHLLQKRGFQVVIGNNGREALALIEKQPFDLILMDLQMPEMGGLEATAAIRLREKGDSRRIPIIALTAHASAGDREICLAAGMDDHVAKPINRAKLFAAIDAQLSPGKNTAR